MLSEPTIGLARVDRDALRERVREKYRDVALNPELGFHFHTGAPLAAMLGYAPDLVAKLPPATVESFAGTGNPFLFGDVQEGETVVDVGCGAGMDTLIAALATGAGGQVWSVDMTPEMRERARAGAAALGLANVTVLEGFAESLPVPDETADIVISNGVVNLCPDKRAVLSEMYRVLKPGARLQVADILVHREVSQEAKDDIDLWSG